MDRASSSVSAGLQLLRLRSLVVIFPDSSTPLSTRAVKRQFGLSRTVAMWSSPLPIVSCETIGGWRVTGTAIRQLLLTTRA